MTISQLPWWIETDRAKLHALCREINEEQGILAVMGDEAFPGVAKQYN